VDTVGKRHEDRGAGEGQQAESVDAVLDDRGGERAHLCPIIDRTAGELEWVWVRRRVAT
jgi:hypothetical protein